MSTADRDETYRRFRGAVNMAPAELARWLDTPESKAVGERKHGAESTGHRTGRRVVALLRAKRSELTDRDYAQLRKVAAFVRRRLAQRPPGDISHTRYRYSLMNWGHDPLKD